MTYENDPSDPASWDPKFDAVAAAPDHHKVIFENDMLRVLEVTLHPNEEEPLHHHRWPSVFVLDAVNPDIHDIRERLPLRGLNAAFPNPLAKRFHASQGVSNPGAHIFIINHQGRPLPSPKRSVQNCPPFGGVDLLTRKHLITPRFDPGFPRQIQQQ